MVKVNSKSQKGRSMVEMLGVLSIIGVLSVGGISAYSVAMKKHKANELLQRASMLASTVSAQIMSGKEPTTLDTFADSNLGKFALDYDPTKTTFDLKISELDGSVCSQLKEGGMVQKVQCNETAKTATITYYKNLATDPAEGEKSPTGGSAGTPDPLCKDVKCESGEECIGGVCAMVSGECSNNSDCDDWCKKNGGGVACYCSIINVNHTGDDSACYDNFTSQCAVATSEIKGGYVVGRDSMIWWSAVNFCKAHDKSLVSLADLGITGGYQGDGYCEGSECTGTVDWSDLQKKIGTATYWTTDAVSCDADWNCNPGSNNNSCSAFTVTLGPDNVGYGGPRGGLSLNLISNFALCR